MNVDGIKNGIVIDHISAGKAMQLYRMLGLERLDCCIAVIQNVQSNKMGKKDIIKIDSDIHIDLDVIGFISPDATVNVIRDARIIDKKHIAPPKRLVDIIRCKNPRCITTTEQEIRHVFIQTGRGEYRCVYCDTKATL